MLWEKWYREFFFKQNLRAGIKTLSWGIVPYLCFVRCSQKSNNAENNVCHLSKCNVYPKCIIYPFIKVYYLSRLGHLGISHIIFNDLQTRCIGFTDKDRNTD